MELDNVIGKKIEKEREAFLQAAAEQDSRNAEVQAEQERKKELYAKIHRPYDLVTKLAQSQGYKFLEPDSEAGESDFETRFRLCPSVTAGIEQKTQSVDLIITGRIRVASPGYGDIPGPFNLSLAVSSPGEPESIHYLTTIGKPIIATDGMPEDYGMRTYKKDERDTYEVSSSKPSYEEAEVIISAIEEAAELNGVFLNCDQE